MASLPSPPVESLSVVEDYILSPESIERNLVPSSPVDTLQSNVVFPAESPANLSRAFRLRLQSKPTTALSISTTSPPSSVSTSSPSQAPTSANEQGVDVKSLLGKILTENDTLSRPHASTFNNSFIETDVDDDSVTVYDNYDITDDDDDKDKDELQRFHAQKKQFFIISFAGKPIFSMNGGDDLISSYMGVIQALIAGFEQPSDDYPSDTNRDVLR